MNVILSESDILESDTLTSDEKQLQYESLFLRYSRNNEIDNLKDALNAANPPDINCKDTDSGSTALIFASCFGHVEAVKLLLDKNAKVDETDANGWTALLWACSNGHDEIAKMLISHGASENVKSGKGRSLKELVSTTSNAKRISKIIDLSSESVSSFDSEIKVADISFDSSRKSVDEFSVDGSSDEEDILEVSEFDWDNCSASGMYVFEEKRVDHIIDIAVNKLRPRPPTPGSEPRFIPPLSANILFLCLRYAHYFNTPDFLVSFFDKATTKVMQSVKDGHDLHLVAYWITNLSQLFFYIKKEPKLLISTIDCQLSTSELLQSLSVIISSATHQKLLPLMDQAIISYSSNSTPNTSFEGLVASLSRRKSILKPIAAIKSIPSPSSNYSNNWLLASNKPIENITPRSLTRVLSTTLKILKTQRVNKMLLFQIFDQIFYTLGGELFNLVLSVPYSCSKSRGVQIRMNITSIEEWIRENWNFFKGCDLNRHLKSIIHLTQFLQVCSSFEDLDAFLETLSTLDGITLVQARKAMEVYKYEVGEESFSEEIELYCQNKVEGLLLQQSDRNGDDDTDNRVQETIDSSKMLPFKVPNDIGLNYIPKISQEELEMLENEGWWNSL